MLNRTSVMDMLHGPMLKKMLIFALPIAAGSVLQQLFNAVDVAVVGRFASSEALAAVGANTSVVSLLVNLFVGISVGCNAVIAYHIGSKENDKASRTVHTSLLIGLIGGIFLMILGLVIARWLLSLLSTPENVIDMAVLYLRIYCIGMPFIMIYNFCAAILRSIGDTKRPLICLLVSGVINAALNLFFVIVLKMSVSGVAIATVISNVISSGMAIYFLLHADEVVRLNVRNLRLDREEMVRVLKIGIPAGLQGVVFSVANVCIQASVNSFGSNAVAGSSIAQNFEYISFYTVSGYNSAVLTFAGQNYGANDWARCKKAYILGLVSAASTLLIMNNLFYLFRNPLIGIFTKDPEVAEFAVFRLRYVVRLHFLICSYEITGSFLRGLGRSLLPALITVFGTCVLRLVYINTLVIAYHTFKNLMLVYPFSWIITGIMMITAFLIVIRKIKGAKIISYN